MALTSIGTIQHIAIVGGGPSGVAAAKAILTEIDEVIIDIFEQRANFGGAWNYSEPLSETVDVPQTNPEQPLEEPSWIPNDSGLQYTHVGGAIQATFDSPMYRGLESNIPHCLMKFSDAPALEDNQLFPSCEEVRRYLEDYSEDVRRLVRFQTQVIDVRPKSQENLNGWVVRFRDLLNPQSFYEGGYDAVVVANGHYTIPHIPDIKGIREWNRVNPGVISHSKSYRSPEPFADKKVMVVGNNASGTDIASQIATVSKHPILNSTKSDSPLEREDDYRKKVPEISDFLLSDHGTRSVRFTDGRVEKDIDAILFCTGYYYSFPFMSSLPQKLIASGERVQHLYEHIWYIPDPTLVFVGLPSKILPFRTVEGQSAVIARVFSGRLELPSRSKMRNWETNTISERGEGKSFHVLPFPKDLEYHNRLVIWASNARQRSFDQVPPQWTKKEAWLRERFPAIKRAYIAKKKEKDSVRTVEDLGFDYDTWVKDQSNGISAK